MTLMPEKKEHQADLPLGVALVYRGGKRVVAFGRERDKDGAVEYYWVVGANGNRFKALPSELKL